MFPRLPSTTNVRKHFVHLSSFRIGLAPLPRVCHRRVPVFSATHLDSRGESHLCSSLFEAELSRILCSSSWETVLPLFDCCVSPLTFHVCINGEYTAKSNAGSEWPAPPVEHPAQPNAHINEERSNRRVKHSEGMNERQQGSEVRISPLR